MSVKRAWNLMKEHNACPDDFMMVGDRLYTDIASGVNAGVDTICVLSGESRLEDIEKSEIKPTYVYKDIKEILKDLQE